MKVLHIVGRIGLAVPFVVLGYVTAAAPGDRVRAAERLGLPQPELIVRANGAAMVTGALRSPSVSCRGRRLPGWWRRCCPPRSPVTRSGRQRTRPCGTPGRYSS